MAQNNDECERSQAGQAFQRDQTMDIKNALERGRAEGQIHVYQWVMTLPRTPMDELEALSLDELQARREALEQQMTEGEILWARREDFPSRLEAWKVQHPEEWERYQARLKFQRDQMMFRRELQMMKKVGEIHYYQEVLKLPETPSAELMLVRLEELVALADSLRKQLVDVRAARRSNECMEDNHDHR